MFDTSFIMLKKETKKVICVLKILKGVNSLFFLILLPAVIIFITKTLRDYLGRQQNMEATCKLSNEETTSESKRDMPALQV